MKNSNDLCFPVHTHCTPLMNRHRLTHSPTSTLVGRACTQPKESAVKNSNDLCFQVHTHQTLLTNRHRHSHCPSTLVDCACPKPKESVVKNSDLCFQVIHRTLPVNRHRFSHFPQHSGCPQPKESTAKNSNDLCIRIHIHWTLSMKRLRLSHSPPLALWLTMYNMTCSA